MTPLAVHETNAADGVFFIRPVTCALSRLWARMQTCLKNMVKKGKYVLT